MMSQMKLSEIWDKADKELKQLHRRFGNRHERAACALGAVAYFTTDHEDLADWLPDNAWKKPKEIIRFEMKFGDITDLNDYKGWTFKQFADAARAIGE